MANTLSTTGLNIDTGTAVVPTPTNATHATTKAYVDGLTSASNILTQLKTVDGTGSGLDSDLLDGFTGSAYGNPQDSGLVGYWSLDGIPEYPNNPSGVIYSQNEWTTIDGHIFSNHTISVSGGKLVAEKTSSTAGSVYKSISFSSGYSWRAKIKLVSCSQTSGNFIRIERGGDPNVVEKEVPINIGQEVFVAVDMSGAGTGYFVSCNGFEFSGTYRIEIDWIYFGNGSYLPNSLLDNSGNGNHGQIFGATPVDGVSGKALSFDGVNDYCRTTNPITFADQSTLVLWLKPTASAINSQVYVGQGQNNQARFLIGRTVNTNTLFIRYYTNTNVEVSSANFFAGLDGTNVLVGLVIDWTTGAITVYRNGLFWATLQFAANWQKPVNLPLFFGNSAELAAGNFAICTIDEPRIYNRALTADEVFGLYQNKKGSDSLFRSIPPVPLSYAVRDKNGVVESAPVQINSGVLGYWSLDDVPEYPTGTATYFQDVWGTTDGWSGINVTITSTGGKLVSSNNTNIDQYIQRTFSAIPAGTTIKVKVKRISGNATSCACGGTVMSALQEFSFNSTGEAIASFTTTAAGGTTVIIYPVWGGRALGDLWEIDWIYVGNGSYLPNSLLDNSGNGNHGQIFGATPVDGVSGKALSFDGVNDYAITPHALKGKNIFSLSFWLNDRTTGAFSNIFTFDDGNNSTSFRMETTSIGNYSFYGIGPVPSATNIRDIGSNVTRHLVLVCDGVNWRFYVDGVSFVSGLQTVNPISINSNNIRWASRLGTSFSSCLIDEPRIYNHALTAAEVWELYANPGTHSIDGVIRSTETLPLSVAMRDANGALKSSGGTVWSSGNDGNGGQQPAPKPRAATDSDIGQFVKKFAQAGNALSAPAGGTWAFFVLHMNSDGTIYNDNSGVVPGGSVVLSGVSGKTPFGFFWRIA